MNVLNALHGGNLTIAEDACTAARQVAPLVLQVTLTGKSFVENASLAGQWNIMEPAVAATKTAFIAERMVVLVALKDFFSIRWRKAVRNA